MVWIHVGAAAIWIGSSACVLIAVGVLPPASAECERFASRALPVIARLNLLAAALVFLAGAVRFVDIGTSIGYQFSPGFLGVLAAKMALFAAMGAAALLSCGVYGREAADCKDRREAEARMRTAALGRAARLAGAVLVMGGIAAALGIWLAGAVRG